MSHAHTPLPAAPGQLTLPPVVQRTAIAATAIGGAALAWAFTTDLHVAWSAYLIGVFFVLGLAVFGIAWLAILHLAGATWSVTMRRIPEAMTAWLLPGGVLSMLVLLGARTLYHWANGDAVAHDELLLHKAPFLNATMFAALVGVSLCLWILFAAVMVRISRRQDRDGGMAPTRTSRKLSALFLVIFAVTMSIVSYYFLLSLDAHWFSTMFAVLVFTDVLQSGTAFVALIASLVAAGALKEFVNENHLHSLAKMVFATTGFWAYIYFCQFMLIWYANIPEETVYFLRRADNGWLAYVVVLPFLKFVLPFVLLLPRDAKRRARTLVPVALLILFAQFWELYVMVAPAVGHGTDAVPHARLPLLEFAATVGFTGLFTLVFGWSLSRHDAVPLKDPALADCLAYHS